MLHKFNQQKHLKKLQNCIEKIKIVKFVPTSWSSNSSMSSSSSKTFSFSSSCLFTIFHRKQWKFNQNNQLWRFWNKFYVRTQSTIFERSSRSTTLDSFSFSSSSFFAWSSAIVGMLKSLLYTKFVTKTCAETTSETQTFYDLSVWTLNFDDKWFRRRSTTEPTCIYLVHKWTMHQQIFRLRTTNTNRHGTFLEQPC